MRAPEGKASRLVWVQEIEYPGASYIAPHFSHFDLPDDAHLVVRAPDRSRRWELRGHGKKGLAANDGFWGIQLAGDRAVVELHAAGPLTAGAVTIDRYARGFPEAFAPQPPETICSADDSREAKCYQSSQPTVYNRSRAVARLLIGGTGDAPAGWWAAGAIC